MLAPKRNPVFRMHMRACQPPAAIQVSAGYPPGCWPRRRLRPAACAMAGSHMQRVLGRNLRHAGRAYATLRRFDRVRFSKHLALAERAVQADDTAALVDSWLFLASEKLSLKDQRALGYRPLDRLSGYDELRPGSAAFTDGVAQAVAVAASSGDPWACWGMAQRSRHGVGVRASTAAALNHARMAAEGGVIEAQAQLAGWLLDALEGGGGEGAQQDTKEGRRWCEAAATAGHLAARFRLEELKAGRQWRSLARASTTTITTRVQPPSTPLVLELEWGVARYYDSGWEGWGTLPLLPSAADPTALSVSEARRLAAVRQAHMLHVYACVWLCVCVWLCGCVCVCVCVCVCDAWPDSF